MQSRYFQLNLDFTSFMMNLRFFLFSIFRSRQEFLQKFQSNTLRTDTAVDGNVNMGRSISWTLVDEEKEEV